MIQGGVGGGSKRREPSTPSESLAKLSDSAQLQLPNREPLDPRFPYYSTLLATLYQYFILVRRVEGSGLALQGGDRGVMFPYRTLLPPVHPEDLPSLSLYQIYIREGDIKGVLGLCSQTYTTTPNPLPPSYIGVCFRNMVYTTGFIPTHPAPPQQGYTGITMYASPPLQGFALRGGGYAYTILPVYPYYGVVGVCRYESTVYTFLEHTP